MNTGEIAEYGRARSRRRLFLVGVGGVGALALTLFLWSPGGDPKEFRLGSECTSDCGSSSMVGWLCVTPEQGARYCSRPCGGVDLACPDGMECQQARAEEALAAATQDDRAAMYCYFTDSSRMDFSPITIDL
jgi:hypothetical protein